MGVGWGICVVCVCVCVCHKFRRNEYRKLFWVINWLCNQCFSHHFPAVSNTNVFTLYTSTLINFSSPPLPSPRLPPSVGMVDVVFADVAQPDQARILALNCHHFLKNQGHFVISIKVCCEERRGRYSSVITGWPLTEENSCTVDRLKGEAEVVVVRRGTTTLTLEVTIDIMWHIDLGVHLIVVV